MASLRRVAAQGRHEAQVGELRDSVLEIQENVAAVSTSSDGALDYLEASNVPEAVAWFSLRGINSMLVNPAGVLE